MNFNYTRTILSLPKGRLPSLSLSHFFFPCLFDVNLNKPAQKANVRTSGWRAISPFFALIIQTSSRTFCSHVEEYSNGFCISNGCYYHKSSTLSRRDENDILIDPHRAGSSGLAFTSMEIRGFMSLMNEVFIERFYLKVDFSQPVACIIYILKNIIPLFSS